MDLYGAFIVVSHTQGAQRIRDFFADALYKSTFTQVRITQCYLQITPYMPPPRKHSPDGASPDWGCGHLIAAYYSFIYPERMKGWVGLVGWPTADGLPTQVVTRQPQVERRTAKVRLSETDVLPLCHATNRMCITGLTRPPTRERKAVNEETASGRFREFTIKWQNVVLLTGRHSWQSLIYYNTTGARAAFNERNLAYR